MSAAPAFRDSAATAKAARAGLLYERYARQLLGFCRSRLGSQEEAEDALQQTFLNAHRSLRSGTVPRAEAAWMYAIAANVCRERRRSAWRRSRVEVVSDDGLVGEQAAPEHSHEQLEGVADALAELTENQRRAILMREWQGLSYSEIAAELALTQGAVETLLFRARRSLAQKLDRSRGRIWGISNLGSGLAWAKAVLSGTAAQIAAATLVVAAGVTAASPVVTLHGSTRAAAVRLQPMAKAAAPARRPRVAAVRTPTRTTSRQIVRRHGRPVVSPRPANPSEPVSAPVTVTQPAPAAAPPVTVPPPPPAPAAPQLPRVEVPPLPAVPPLPPVSVPSVPLPNLPKLPDLPKLP